MEINCGHCGAAFRDATGQLSAVLTQATAGRLALALGCGRCGALFFPALTATPTVAHSPAASSRTQVQPAQPRRLAGADRYELHHKLGEGGMGVVRLATDQNTRRLVCVKQLHGRVDPSSLRQELEALARLDHPNIVRLLDRYEHQGSMHLVLEYVDGTPLDRYLVEHGPLSETAALALLAPIFEAIAFGHQASVTHRDLKPANVLIEWLQGVARPRLLDYGIAIVDDVDARGAVTGQSNPAGTPLYMAPEQIAGERVSPQADGYAAGVMLAELLLGRVPFTAQTLFGLMKEKMELRDGLALPDGVASTELAALVRALTRFDPGARPSAAEAAQRARALLGPQRTGTSLAPWNLSFAHSTDDAPLGWHGGADFVHGVSSAYQAQVRTGATGTPGPHVQLTAPPDADESFGTLMQSVPVRALDNATVHFSAWLATEGVTRGASLWVRVDDARGQTLAFDNMSDRALRGDQRWKPLELSLRLPPGAAWLSYGVLLIGPGSARATALTLTATRRDGQRLALHLDRLYSHRNT